MNFPRIAIVYDRLNTYGGAERVLQALHDEFPSAPLYASVCDRKKAKWLGDWKVYTTFLQGIPFARNHHQWFGWLMPFAFETLDLSAYDVIISVTSEAAKGILTLPHQKHICYCLTPTRYLWSHTHEYEGTYFRWLKRFFFHSLRLWDYIAGQRPDQIIPISYRVKARIEKYYRRDTGEVIYPPVTLPEKAPKIIQPSEKDYFLVVSRLVPYKRVDLAIQACIQMKQKVKIVGTGTDVARLKKIAHNSPYVEFLGFVSNDELDTIYANAKGLICPQEEDFGIVSLEAQARNVPVLSYERSGVAETIEEGKTGVLFPKQTVESLVDALVGFMPMHWKEADFAQHVRGYSVDIFNKKFARVVQSALENESVDRVM